MNIALTDTLNHDQRAIVRNLIALARATCFALEDAEEVQGDDGICYQIPADNIDAITDVLDQLDELPDDRPGFTMNEPMKAEWALRMREESFDARIERRILAAQLNLRVHVEILGNRAQRNLDLFAHQKFRELREFHQPIKHGENPCPSINSTSPSALPPSPPRRMTSTRKCSARTSAASLNCAAT